MHPLDEWIARRLFEIGQRDSEKRQRELSRWDRAMANSERCQQLWRKRHPDWKPKSEDDEAWQRAKSRYRLSEANDAMREAVVLAAKFRRHAAERNRNRRGM